MVLRFYLLNIMFNIMTTKKHSGLFSKMKLYKRAQTCCYVGY